MGQARDEAGNVWETDAGGNPVRLIAPAGQGGVQTKAPDPTMPYKGPTAAANLAGQQASTAKTQAEQPYVAPKAAADTARAQQNVGFDRSQAASQLTQNFIKDPRVANYLEVLPNAVSAMSARDDAQGDLTVVYAWAKAMDPSGSVREGDTDMANSTGSYIQQAQQYVAQLNSGKRLPPAVRKGLIEEIRNKGGSLEKGYAEAREQYQSLAQQGGIPPEVVIGPHAGQKFNAVEQRYIRAAQAPNKEIATGDTKTEFASGPTAQLDAMIRAGVPFDQANAAMKKLGGDPLNARTYAQVVKFARDNPGFKGSLAEVTQTLPTTPTEQIAAQLVGPNEIGLAKGFTHSWDRAAMGVEGALNAIPGVDLSAAHDSAAQRQAAFEGLPANQTAEDIGQLGGAALFSAPLRGPMAAGAVGNMLMGDATDPLGIATEGAVGAAGGKVADFALRGASALAAPVGRDALRRMNAQGVHFSPGQVIGGRARNLEDRLTANPVLGPKIDAMRTAGMEQANLIPAQRALGSIGESVPPNIRPGHEAVGYTGDRLGQFYDDTLNGQSINLDPTYVSRLNVIGQRSNMRPEEFNKFSDIFQREVGGAFQNGHGQMNGQTFKKLDSRLGKLGSDFKNSTNVFERDIGDAILKVKDQTRALARRQNPEMGARLRAADEGYAQFKILQRAAAANPATGMFGAGQLRTAIRQGDRSVGKGATARGEANMQDLASDMSQTMPSTIGSSGTSEREQVNKMTPWLIGAGLSPLYSPLAQQFVEKTMLRTPSGASKATAKLLDAVPRGMFGAAIPYWVNSGQGY